ncbi:uncharacterized protein LOC130966624 [Arachis stenosperma]|uniref:uncharacterized protein LOC130966624 n=1 Tax=Arachis stenosperma TaxID=217475 RepID=UPI0025ACAD57|nr:uncharacterized protein LOC130966624 [Arachis stenosperma]
MSVKEAMKPPNGRKIVLRFNSALQLVGDEAGIVSGVMGMLGSDYTKFPICEKDWRKEMFHFDEDSRGIIKRIIFKMLGRGKYKKNAENRSKQLYTHTGGSKSLARLGEEESERQGRRVSRGELYLLTHKRANVSYVHDAARAIGERIEAIEQRDESSRLLSHNDSLAQTLEKEHPGRVRGMGLGPTSNQVFDMNFHQPSNGFERKETQRVLLELQAELTAEKLKRKAVEDEVAAEKTKRQAVEDKVVAEKTKRQVVEDKVVVGKVRMQAMESALICLLQGQGGKLPSDVTAWMSALEEQIRK